jgi:hypothetical protein
MGDNRHQPLEDIMEEVQIFGKTCGLERTFHELRINTYEGNLALMADQLEEPSNRLIIAIHYRHIRLRSTFYCNGGMINIPWEEWSTDRLVTWLEEYFQEGIKGLPDWCTKPKRG